ncbi:MAG: hypothetical protein RL441_1324 [Actinomycetota bacterium]
MTLQGWLITDPDCGFCQRSAGWLVEHFAGPWKNTPATSAVLSRFDITEEQASQAVWFVVTSDDLIVSKHRGSSAVARLISLRGGFWNAARIAEVPPFVWLAQSAYRVIARNRHRLPGATAACELPKAE